MEKGPCSVCAQIVDVSVEVNSVRLTCRHCGEQLLHTECHMKRMKSIMHNADMIKSGHAANFPCPAAGCPGKIKNLAWIEGKRNEDKKQKRIQAAIKAAELQAAAKRAPKPTPAAKPKLTPRRLLEPAQPQRSAGAPTPVTLKRTFTKEAKLTEAQQAAMLKTLREHKAAAQRELGLALGRAAPVTAQTPAPRAPTPSSTGGVSILRAGPRMQTPPAPQPAKSWGTAAAAGASVEGRLRNEMQTIIPGAVFVEPKVKKGKQGKGKQEESGPSGTQTPCSPAEPQELLEELLEGSGGLDADEWEKAHQDKMRNAASQHGYVNDASKYLQLLRSMGVAVTGFECEEGDDSDMDTGDDEGEEARVSEGGSTVGCATSNAGSTSGGAAVAISTVDSIWAAAAEEALLAAAGAPDAPVAAGLEGAGVVADDEALLREVVEEEDAGLDETGVFWFRDESVGGTWFAAYPDGCLEAVPGGKPGSRVDASCPPPAEPTPVVSAPPPAPAPPPPAAAPASQQPVPALQGLQTFVQQTAMQQTVHQQQQQLLQQPAQQLFQQAVPQQGFGFTQVLSQNAPGMPAPVGAPNSMFGPGVLYQAVPSYLQPNGTYPATLGGISDGTVQKGPVLGGQPMHVVQQPTLHILSHPQLQQYQQVPQIQTQPCQSAPSLWGGTVRAAGQEVKLPITSAHLLLHQLNQQHTIAAAPVKEQAQEDLVDELMDLLQKQHKARVCASAE